jgi:Secretion system C-terminal sorting domain
MKKYITVLFLLFSFSRCFAQPAEGSIAPDFTVTDINNNSYSLYEKLDEGKIVVLHFFASWDSFSWDYLQSGEMQSLYSLYGPEGTDQIDVWSIESEPNNSLAQLQGPAAITGDQSTQTYGDWITNNVVPIIDSSAIAELFQIEYLPTVLIICPDKIINVSSEVSAASLMEEITEQSCQSLTTGNDPAIFSPAIERSCGSTNVDISFALKNLGTELLTAADIQVIGVSGNPTISWNGELLSYQSDTLIFEDVQLINDDPVQIVVLTPNVLTTNDSLSVTSAVGLSTLSIQLELAIDNYPEEVSWEIRNDNDSIIYSGGDYEVAYQYINTTFTLPAVGCYSFYLYDTEGDGLHGSQWGGFDGSCYLRSLDSSANVTSVLYSYNGSYNFSATPNTPSFEKAEFEAGSSLSISSEGLISLMGAVYPNPGQDIFWLTFDGSFSGSSEIIISDQIGNRVFSSTQKINPGMEQIQLNLGDLASGMYMITFLTDGKMETQTIVISR